MKLPSKRLRVVTFSLVTFLFVSSSAFSSVLIVSNTQDNGNDSLRTTIAAAAVGDTIEFNIPISDPGYDPLAGIFTIRLTSGEIVIQSDLTIANPSGAKIAISGNHASRIFNITAGTVAISDLSLIDCTAQGANGLSEREAGAAGIGGAVLNQGTLTVTRCTFKGNTARGGVGSYDFAFPGAGGDGLGGAIANQNSLSLVACTLANNSAFGNRGGAVEHYPCYCWYAGPPGRASGGAIHNAAGSNLSLNNCTITGNIVTGGDALVLSDFYWAMSGGVGQGGGIANFGNLAMVHCTVANNTCTAGASAAGYPGPNDGGASSGGGVYNAEGSVLTTRDSILAPNTTVGGAPSGPPANIGPAIGPDVNGAITSEGHNLVGRSDGSTGFTGEDQQGGTTHETALDPKLDILANNAGPTETIALLPGSPAIGAGAPGDTSRDQRYFERNGTADIGAFEYQGTQPVMLANISTRLRVRAGDNAMIGGFIITGTVPKTLIVRGIGPSLSVADALADPMIEVHGDASQLLSQNDDWRSATTSQEVIGGGLPPTNDLESALWGTLNPGAYSVVVRGKNDSTGIALFEVYDQDQTVDAKLANVSTRGFVETGDNVMIGGTIIVGSAPRILFRAIGPSLADFGVGEALQDPTMELYDSNGQVIAINDNWRESQENENEIIATGIPPSNELESAIVRDLTPGPYTAVLRGANDTTGVALIEVYDLN